MTGALSFVALVDIKTSSHKRALSPLENQKWNAVAIIESEKRQ